MFCSVMTSPERDAVDAPGSEPDFGIRGVFAQLGVTPLEHQAGLVFRINGDQLANAAVVDAGNDFLVGRHGAGLKINLERQLLLGGLPPALANRLAAGNIHGDGLGQINVFARLNGRRGLLGVKIGRALDGHGVHFLLQQPLVTRQSRNRLFDWHVEFLPGVIDPVLKVIRKPDDIVMAVFGQQLAIQAPRPPQPMTPMSIFEFASAPPRKTGLEDRQTDRCRSGAGQELAASDIRAAEGRGEGVGCGAVR